MSSHKMMTDIVRQITLVDTIAEEEEERPQNTHMALRLPEIVDHIISFLTIPYQLDENHKHKMYKDIYPCLLVNGLWHDCAIRWIWKHVTFEDSKSEYEALLKFCYTVGGNDTQDYVPAFPMRSSSTAANLAIASPLDAPLSQCSDNKKNDGMTSSTSANSLAQQFVQKLEKHRFKYKLNFNSYQAFNNTNSSSSSSSKNNNKSSSKKGNEDPMITGNSMDVFNQPHQQSNTISLSNNSLSSSSSATTRITNIIDNSLRYYPSFYSPYAHYSQHRKAIRSITLRKIKDRSINKPLMQIGRYTQRLEKLDIYICDHLADSSIHTFITHNHRSLTFLSLAGCNRITDEAIISVAHHCPQLVHLDLRACGLISDISIKAIATHCPNLFHLNVGRVRDREKITMASINMIAQKTQVGVLGLAGCDITDECLILLAQARNRGLERISVNNCYKITNRALRAYVRFCPNLSVFEMKECHRITDWSAVAELVQRKVLLTLCEQQNKACLEWARQRGRILTVKPPIKSP